MTVYPDNYSQTKADIDFAWQVAEDSDYAPQAAIEAGLLMMQAIARNLAVLADQAIDANNQNWGN